MLEIIVVSASSMVAWRSVFRFILASIPSASLPRTQDCLVTVTDVAVGASVTASFTASKIFLQNRPSQL